MNRALSKTKVKMKTILVIVLIFIGGIQSFGQGIEFFKGDYNAALEKPSKRERCCL